MSDYDTVLIVDGDMSQASILANAINEKLKYKTMIATSCEQVVNMLRPADCTASIMLLDMRVLQADAIRVINVVKHCKPGMPIIIITEYGGTESAVEAIHAGATDFLVKPLTIERIGLSVASALRIRHLCKMIEVLEKQLESDGVVNVKANTDSHKTFVPADGTVKKLRHLEEDAIRHALSVCGGSMSKAARSLGIGRSTLYRKVGELNRHKKQNGQIARENHTILPATVISETRRSYAE